MCWCLFTKNTSRWNVDSINLFAAKVFNNNLKKSYKANRKKKRHQLSGLKKLNVKKSIVIRKLFDVFSRSRYVFSTCGFPRSVTKAIKHFKGEITQWHVQLVSNINLMVTRWTWRKAYMIPKNVGLNCHGSLIRWLWMNLSQCARISSSQ